MYKKRIATSVFAAAAITLGMAGTLFAGKAKVIGSIHDVGGNGCGSCHTPHNGSAATSGTDQSTGQLLLWDRGFSSQTFGTYDSPTVENKATEIGGLPLASSEARMYSLLCMSCHDGVTTPGVMAAADSHSVGNPSQSFGLSNDHPINMSYDPSKDTGLAAVANVTSGGLALFNNTVQCASCHEPHDNTQGGFLRKSNATSAVCTTCHL